MSRHETEPKKQLSQEASNVLGGILLSSPLTIEGGVQIAQGEFLIGGALSLAAGAMTTGIIIAANMLRLDINK